MKRIKIVSSFFLCFIYVSLSIFLYSAEEGFLYQLKRNLNAYGWSKEEITPFMHAAQHMSWESVENGYADVVAYSLHYCKRSGTETTPEEKAELAYQLAIATSDMGAVGFDEDVIVRVAINTSREFVGALNQYRKEGSEEGLGEMIRERIREQVCNEGTEAQQAKIMERVRNRTGANANEKGKQNHGAGHGPHH